MLTCMCPEMLGRCTASLPSSCMSATLHYEIMQYFGMRFASSFVVLPNLRVLWQALDLARESGDSIRDQVWHELGKAKYASWESRAAQRQSEHQQLQQRLQHILQAKQEAESCSLQVALP